MRPDEYRNKAILADQCAQGPSALAGCETKSLRSSILERADAALWHAKDSLRRAGAAERVREIAQKYPEIVELLDLLNEL